MLVSAQLKHQTALGLKELYQFDFQETAIPLNQTKPEFEGDYTIVLFSFIKQLKKNPDVLGNELGQWLVANAPQLVKEYNVIKGFLNITVLPKVWADFLHTNYDNSFFGTAPANGKTVMVEYASPNTNKPLHLGHLRNIFLGWSVAQIYKANGYNVVKSCIVNDRGIHICKSMIAWQLFADGATPQSTNTKGDHFVGDYYVKFNDEYKRQLSPILSSIYNLNRFEIFLEEEQDELEKHVRNISQYENLINRLSKDLDFEEIDSFGLRVAITAESALDGNTKWKNIYKVFDSEEFADMDIREKESKQKRLQQIFKPIATLEDKIENEQAEVEEIAGRKTEIMKAAQQMLFDWERGKPDVIELWKKMNSWVYEGFDETYKSIGADFDKTYYESNTYLLGKEIVQQGLEKNVFYKKEDGSVWIDLTAEGLDEKLVLRKDGTSVYITQDIGLAEQKYNAYKMDESIYVIGDEQNYHMKVLQAICRKMEMPFAGGIYHLSYGMVELPTGRMKSREGTVVDADDMVAEMKTVAAQKTEELGKVKDFNNAELEQLYTTLGLGALKFYLLRVDPKKKMIFNPEESIEFQGFTGPFVQYTYARIQSIFKKIGEATVNELTEFQPQFLPLEKDLLFLLEQYPEIISQAAAEMNPSHLAIYIFRLASLYNSFYTEHSIANAETEEKKQLRLVISAVTARVIKNGMELMGIDVPERM